MAILERLQQGNILKWPGWTRGAKNILKTKFTLTLELFPAKNGWKKHSFAKWPDFETWQKRPFCNGYSKAIWSKMEYFELKNSERCANTC